MRELFQETILPLVVVVAFVFGVTVLVFDIPAEPLGASSGLRPGASAALRRAAEPPGLLPPAETVEARRPMRETANEVLSRAMRTLDAPAGPRGSSPGSAPAMASTTSTSSPTSSTQEKAEETTTAMSAIAAALRATREARTEADLIHAEEALREARRRMQAGCAATGGPLCKSAEEMQRLGF